MELSVLFALDRHEATTDLLARGLGKEVALIERTLARMDGSLVERDEHSRWALSAEGRKMLDGFRRIFPTSLEEPSTLASVDDDSETRALIASAGVQARLLVHAGPGTGKTHEAIIRARKLAEVVDPTRLLFISFSRAATATLRERAGAHGLPEDMDIRTIDSLGAMLHRRPLGGDYDRSIANACDEEEHWYELIASRYQHVFVDEAQDILDQRAVLVHAVLRAVCSSGEGGFTVLYDSAQAIHDYTSRGSRPTTLIELLDTLGPQRLELLHVHRTANEELERFVRQVRRATLVQDTSRLAQLRSSRKSSWGGGSPVDSRGELWLFRKNAQVLGALKMIDGAVPASLRGSRWGHVVEPALGRLLVSDDRCIDSLETLESLLRVHGNLDEARPTSLIACLERERVDRGGQLDDGALARVLCRHRVDPVWHAIPSPDAITLSTVHASKGCEADVVRYFDEERGVEQAEHEELRVLHVALSRAREQLHIHALPQKVAYNSLGTGERIKAKRNRYIFCVEVGLTGDVDPYHGLGLRPGDRSQTQLMLSSFDGGPRPLTALWCADSQRFYLLNLIEQGEYVVIGALAPSLGGELAGGDGWVHKARKGIWWVGVSTVATSPADSPQIPLAHRYQRHRFWLAPVIAGMSEAREVPAGAREALDTYNRLAGRR